MDVQIPITNRKTIKWPAPQTVQAITQPSHRRGWVEIAQDMRTHGQRAYAVIDEAIERCPDRRVRAMLQTVMDHVLRVTLDTTDLQNELQNTQRAAPPTVRLPEEHREPGRMSLPQLQPMPSAAPFVSATPSLPLRPHKEWKR